MKIGFIGKGNAVRSIMAEAIANKLFADAGIRAEVFSAGIEPLREVHPLTLRVLEKKGYPTKGLYPKPVEKIPYRKLDILVILCNEAKERCEFVISHKRRENWNIDEPVQSEESFLRVLGDIESNIKELLKLQ